MKKTCSFDACRQCIFSAVRRADRAVTRHYERAFGGSKVRATQFTILAALTNDGPLTLTRLAKLLGADRTTLNRNLRAMEEKRWVRSSTIDGDRRFRRLEITPGGLSAAKRAWGFWERAQANVEYLLVKHGIELRAPADKE